MSVRKAILRKKRYTHSMDHKWRTLQSKSNSIKYKESQEMGVKPLPVVSHLGGGEPVMKPPFKKCGLLPRKGIITVSNVNRLKTSQPMSKGIIQ